MPYRVRARAPSRIMLATGWPRSNRFLSLFQSPFLPLSLWFLCQMQPPKRGTLEHCHLSCTRPGQGSMESPIGCMTFSFAFHVYCISLCALPFPPPLLPSLVCLSCALLCLLGRGNCNVWRVQHPRATSRAAQGGFSS